MIKRIGCDNNNNIRYNNVSNANSLLLTNPLKAIYVGYSDINLNNFTQTIKSIVDYGYNLIILAFWIDPSIGTDPYSAAYYWSLLNSADKQSTLDYVHEHNAKIIVSSGGSSYAAYPLNGGSDYGTGAANFALTNQLDGVDFDMENFTNTFGTLSGLTKTQTIQWLTDATNAARSILGSDAIITHAPQSPYFNIEFANGYYDFYMQTPRPSIDYFLIQYYNQGATYLDYQTQFINDDNYHPDTAVAQLISRGLPKEIIIVGKLMQSTDGQSASWVSPQIIAQWVVQAANDSNAYNWTTGISTWQYHATGSPNAQTWIQTIYPNS